MMAELQTLWMRLTKVTRASGFSRGRARHFCAGMDLDIPGGDRQTISGGKSEDFGGLPNCSAGSDYPGR